MTCITSFQARAVSEWPDKHSDDPDRHMARKQAFGHRIAVFLSYIVYMPKSFDKIIILNPLPHQRHVLTRETRGPRVFLAGGVSGAISRSDSED